MQYNPHYIVQVLYFELLQEKYIFLHNNILIYDRSGKIIDSWSVGYNGAHGLTINNEGGEDFLYITDPDSHKFCKTTLKGEKLLEVTFPSEIPDYKTASQFKPTETAISPNGDIYVCDGYGLDYIIQYDQFGNYDLVWWIGIGVGAFSAIIHFPVREKPMFMPMPPPLKEA